MTHNPVRFPSFLHLTLSLCILTFSFALPVSAEAPPGGNWDGPRLKPVDRQEVFEFARPPTFAPARDAAGQPIKDRYEISFASKGYCDVAVAICDAKGKLVRHVVYGVLGPNAPEPLKPDSLEQTLVWDGKDDSGKYMPDAAGCTARVSLGLAPTFDKLIGWHPKDTSYSRNIVAIAADANGVYVMECSTFNQLRKFDHDARYVQTLYPWDPRKLDRIDIPKRSLPDARVWRPGKADPPAGAKLAPVLIDFGGTDPFAHVGTHFSLAAAAGRIAISTAGGLGDNRRLLRLTTDGTADPAGLEGAPFGAPSMAHKSGGGQVAVTFASTAHMALSPDGKWVYVAGLAMGLGEPTNSPADTRLESKPYCWNAVFRFPYESRDLVVGKDSFMGEVSSGSGFGAGSDNAHFNMPRGLATDAAGNLYVADLGNNRVQVFSPAGKYLKTIPIRAPRELAVHQKTGEIYVLGFFPTGGNDRWAGQVTLTKLGPLADPQVRFTRQYELETGDPRFVGFTPVMALDSWASEPRLWVVHDRGKVRIYADRNNDLVKIADFFDELRQAGRTPYMMNGRRMGRIHADPVNGYLWRGAPYCDPFMRIDPEQDARGQLLASGKFPSQHAGRGAIEELYFGLDGMMYVRNLNYIARYDAAKVNTTCSLEPDYEVPFDYGDPVGDGPRGLQSVIPIPWAMGGPNGMNTGFTVAPTGEVFAMMENFQSGDAWKDTRGGYFGAALEILKREMENRYVPRVYPGRLFYGSQLIFRWSNHGEMTGEDLVAGLPIPSCGLRSDRNNNIYVGVGFHQQVNGEPHIGGTLAKFPPHGGRLLNPAAAPAKLDALPDRPPEFIGYGGGGKIWARNLLWSLPGLDQVLFHDSSVDYTCLCNICCFDVDPFGRSFVPRAWGFEVVVLDTNGNRVCNIGRFGNADHPAPKPGDADIGIGSCSFLTTVPDRWLYLNDEANLRIIRLKLGYHAERTVPLRQVEDRGQP